MSKRDWAGIFYAITIAGIILTAIIAPVLDLFTSIPHENIVSVAIKILIGCGISGVVGTVLDEEKKFIDYGDE